VFDIWKFRTMHHHMADAKAGRQTSRDDRRVTRVGRFLRRTSLDELPQLMNVLRGHMSIVGPRPHALGMTVAGKDMTDLAEGYNARHMMKPGITGWAQVNGCRGEIDSERKLRRRLALDCHYIENWSLRADARIILRTAALIAFDRHAY
jgi:lipopolysaccharide/colanic/teichoic acid biosynthesis glycosyltransferase